MIDGLNAIYGRGILVSGNEFLIEIKKNAKKNICPDELYSQQELLEKLEIARNSFKKYFSSDQSWFSKACLKKGRVQYYKGEYVIHKAISISDTEYLSSKYQAVNEAIEEVNDFFNSIDRYLNVPNEFSGVMKPAKYDLFSKQRMIDSFVSMRKDDLSKGLLFKDSSYWQDKLKNKPG